MTPILLIAAALLSPASAGVTTADALKSHVKYLSSDAMEGRLSGSPGERKAGDYAAKIFKENGLKPAGAKETYFQEFDLSVGYKPGVNSRLAIRKNGKDFPAAAGVDFNPMLFSSNDEVTGEVVFVGYGLAKDYAARAVRGKVVVALSHPKTGFREIAKLARAAGVVGILFAGPAQKGMAPLPRINWQNSVSQDSAIVAASISPGYFNKLTGLGYESAKSLTEKGHAPQNPTPNIVSLRCVPEPNNVKGRNIIAMLPGTDPALKNQYIVIGAHIDHVGWGDIGSMSGNAMIHNGADDNASGVATVMELARYYARKKSNRRTLVFQLYSGEEEGLIGSSFFVRNPTIDLKLVTAMINLDMVGNLVGNKLILDGVRSSPVWPQMVSKYTASYKTELDPTGTEDLGGRSDHGPWEGNGIPVMFFYTGEHSRYHRETDDWDLLNYDGMARIASTVADFIADIDARDDLLAFKKGQVVTERKVPQPSGSGNMGRRVRVGLVPNYSDEGPGLLLDGVQPNSPAEKAGLKQGDRIVKWGDKAISSIEDIQDIFINAEPGKAVKVIVRREGKDVELTVTPEPPQR